MAIGPHGTGVPQPLTCTGCGQRIAPGIAYVVIGLRTAYACTRCHDRAQRSPRFREQFECAVVAGVLLPDEALGLPEGTTAAAMGGPA